MHKQLTLLLLLGSFLSIAFGSSLLRSSSSAKTDIENPLLGDRRSNSAGGHSYRLIASDSDVDAEAKQSGDEENQLQTQNPVLAAQPNRAWKIPRGQYDLGIPIYGTIFAFMMAWGEDDLLSLVMRAVYFVSFLVSAQIYFGFYLAAKRGCCGVSWIPSITYHPVHFQPTDFDVSFGRWASGPLSWISEVFSFLPPEAYAYLQEHAYFPHRSVVNLIFMVQLLYYFGVYDMYRNHLMPSGN